MSKYTFIADVRRDDYEYPITGTYTRKSDAIRGLKRYMKRNHRAINSLLIQDNDGKSNEVLIGYNRKYIYLFNPDNHGKDGKIRKYKFSY